MSKGHNYNIDVNIRTIFDSGAGNKMSKEYKLMINQLVTMAQEAGYQIDKALLTSTGKLDFRKNNGIVDWLKGTGVSIKAHTDKITGQLKSFRASMREFGEGAWVTQSFNITKGGITAGTKTKGTSFTALSQEYNRVYSDLIATSKRAAKMQQEDATNVSNAYQMTIERIEQLKLELQGLHAKAENMGYTVTDGLLQGDSSVAKSQRRAAYRYQSSVQDQDLATRTKLTKQYLSLVSQLWKEEEKLAKLRAQKRNSNEIQVEKTYKDELEQQVNVFEQKNAELVKGIKGTNEYNTALAQHNSILQQTTAHYEKTTTLLGKVKANFKNIFAGVLEAGLSWKLFSAGTTAIKNGVETIKELDKAVTDLRIATGYSQEQVRGMVKEYNQMAQDLGATTTDITSAADTWLKILGHLYSNVYEINSLNCWKPLRAL